jgi:hypothetical protein
VEPVLRDKLSLDGRGWDLVSDLVQDLRCPEIRQSISIVGSSQSQVHYIRILSLQWHSGEQYVYFGPARSSVKAQPRLYFSPL